MKQRVTFSPQGPLLDIGYSSLKILVAGKGVAIPLERDESGAVSASSREQLREAVAKVLGRPAGSTASNGKAGGERGLSFRRGRKAVACALPSRGVSLRTFDVPTTSASEIAQVVELQVETEFPLPLDELAWSYVAAPPVETSPSPAPATRVTVAAMRRSLLRDYTDLFRECGLEPNFRLGILAVSRLCPAEAGCWGVLDVGRSTSELLILDGSQPVSLTNIGWGGDHITQLVTTAAGLATGQAERVKSEQQLTNVLSEARADQLLADAAGALAARLEAAWTTRHAPKRLFITGGGARMRGFDGALSAAFGGKILCQRPTLQVSQALTAGHSAVTLGLIEEGRLNGTTTTFAFTAPEPESALKRAASEPSVRPWLLGLVGLVLISLALRYAGLLWQLPHQREELEHARSLHGGLPSLDPELEFLTFLKERQAPYLDALAVIASKFPKGTTIDGISLARTGDVTVNGKTKSPQTVNKFRSDLIASGWFTQVAIENQTPAKKQVTFRLRALLRDERPPLPVPPNEGKGNKPGKGKPSKEKPSKEKPSNGNSGSGPQTAPSGPPNAPPGAASSVAGDPSKTAPGGTAPPTPKEENESRRQGTGVAEAQTPPTSEQATHDGGRSRTSAPPTSSSTDLSE